MIALASMMGSGGTAEAESLELDHGFSIDLDLFDINWTETDKIYVKQDVRSMSSAFDKGVKLGYYRVSIGFATTYKAIDGKIYQRLLVRGEMVPRTVKGKNKGMSQLLEVSVDHSPCSTIKEVAIEPACTSSGVTTYSTTGTLGLSYGKNVSLSLKGDMSFSKNGSLSMGISKTVQYTEGSMIVITNKDDDGVARWTYDYVSANKNKSQNAYLFGSSTQYGVLSWQMPNTKYLVNNLKVTVKAQFGGGNMSNSSIVKRLNGSRILGTDTYSFWITMYDKTQIT